ncbi:MAG: hypothetical protein K0S80_3756 [Neobacillus sp.]|nr:hypothetical protein [Neobacillus sp.]
MKMNRRLNTKKQPHRKHIINKAVIPKSPKYNIDYLPESVRAFIADKGNKNIVIDMLVTHLMKQKGMW